MSQQKAVFENDESYRDQYFGGAVPTTEALEIYLNHFKDLSTLLVDGDRLSSKSASAEVIQDYMGRLSQLPPLDHETQEALLERYYDHGDKVAGQLILLSHLRLVVKIAREHRRRSIDFMELIQEGNVGLTEALHHFDTSRGVLFSTYARYWIKARILGYLIGNSAIVRLGTTRDGRKLFYNLGRARRALRRQGHEPTVAEIAELLQVEESSVVAFTQQVDQPALSTDAFIPGTDVTVAERLVDGGPSPEWIWAERQLKGRVEGAFDDFGAALADERQRTIWFERTLSSDAKTLRQLAMKFDVSTERIRQVENQIKKNFGEFIRERLGDDVELASVHLIAD